MKKALIYSLMLALALSLAACGQPKQDPHSEPDPAPAAMSTPDPAATSTPADISTPEPSQVQTPEPLTEKITTAPTESEDPQEVSEVQLFTDCNETVYATGTVNIRASYTADSNKLGSLTRGQSITRTGVGVNDADGWSRVQLADGSEAYISNKYLSVTKPSTQQSGGQQQSGGSGGQTQQSGQTSKPSGGTQQSQEQGTVSNPNDPYAGMTSAERRQALLDQQGGSGGNTQWTDEEKAEIGKILNGG